MASSICSLKSASGYSAPQALQRRKTEVQVRRSPNGARQRWQTLSVCGIVFIPCTASLAAGVREGPGLQQPGKAVKYAPGVGRQSAPIDKRS
jgi:hypothetical protein